MCEIMFCIKCNEEFWSCASCPVCERLPDDDLVILAERLD